MSDTTSVADHTESWGQATGVGADGELSERELDAVVDRVYRLFRSEVRLSRARGEPLPGRARPNGRPLC